MAFAALRPDMADTKRENDPKKSNEIPFHTGGFDNQLSQDLGKPEDLVAEPEDELSDEDPQARRPVLPVTPSGTTIAPPDANESVPFKRDDEAA